MERGTIGHNCKPSSSQVMFASQKSTFGIQGLKVCYKIHGRSSQQFPESVRLAVWYDLFCNTYTLSKGAVKHFLNMVIKCCQPVDRAPVSACEPNVVPLH